MNAREFSKQRARLEQRFTGRRLKSAMNRLMREAGAEPVVIEGKLAGYALPTGEQVCTKQRYRDSDFASQELERIAAQAAGHIPKRIYLCRFCRGWHMTSQDRVI